MSKNDGVVVPTPEEQAEFDQRLVEARLTEEAIPVEDVLEDGTRVIWRPQTGSQNDFLKSRVLETLYHGTRGPGKTDALIWAYGMHVGKWGPAWRGIIFRQTYPQLADVQAKTEKWFRRAFPTAKFNRSKMMWEWPTGEALLLRHMARPEDYWNYHGHEYPFIGWEELTNWSSSQCFKSMFACCRSSTPGVIKMVRATTNPYGVGHNWVKDRYGLHGRWWDAQYIHEPKDLEGRIEPPRAAIYGNINENKILLAADPDYKRNVIASAANPAMAQAWLSGSWDIVAGGMFDDVWSATCNVVPRFKIPSTWRCDRAFDWGSSKPFSVGWWAESDGSDVNIPGKGWTSTVRGDLFRFNEWYGWSGQPNKGLHMLATEIAVGIIEREQSWGMQGIIKAGPADSSIYDVENGASIGFDMAKHVRVNGNLVPGVQWTRADKRPGSRIAGWETLRKMMKGAKPSEQGPRETPGLFVMDHCLQFIRTVPSLPRCEKNQDDVDTDAEDHIGDEARYRVRATFSKSASGKRTGTY